MSTRISALHGMLGEPADWDFLASALGPEYSIDAADLFGAPFSADFTQVGSKVNTLFSGDILLGYSMGARLALHALTEQPTRWRAAVLISVHPGLDAIDRPARLLSDQAWAKKARTADWSQFLEDWNHQPIFARTESPDRTHLKPVRGAIADAFDRWSLGRQENLLCALTKVPIPTLWITGEADEKFTALAAHASGRIPTAEHAVVPAAFHRPHWENQFYFLTVLQSFLDSLNG